MSIENAPEEIKRPLEVILDDLEKVVEQILKVGTPFASGNEDMSKLNIQKEKLQEEAFVSLARKFKKRPVDINSYDAYLLFNLAKKEIKKKAEKMEGGLKDYQKVSAQGNINTYKQLVEIHEIKDEDEKKNLLNKYGLSEEDLNLEELGIAA